MELKHSIIINSISKSFIEKSTKNKIEVFKNFSLELPIDKKDKIISIVGKSGSGKTTLLKMIAGLDLPDSGSIFVNDIEVKRPTLQTTIIPQSFTCFPWLNVFENIAFGVKIKKSNITEEKVLDIAKQMGLEKRLKAFPNELSGGMQQRVAIGRALAVDTPIIIMDEPFGSLDTVTRKEMQSILLDIAEKKNKLIILVTHDLNEAIFLSDKILILPEQRPINKLKEIFSIPLDKPRTREIYSTNIFLTTLNNLIKLI